jgi:GT2 family glycosyltransferase
MPRTLIAVPSVGINDFRFTLAFASLRKPPGTGIEGVMRTPVDMARNTMARRAVELNYDYVFFIDDDMLPPPTLLEALVAGLEARPDLAALCPMAYRRKAPYWPCVMEEIEWPRYSPIDACGKGVIEADAITFAATLVRASVFKTLAFPWFEFAYHGQDWIGEDMVLCHKMLQAGMKLGCNTDLEVKHIADGVAVGREAWESCKALIASREK